MFNVFKQIKYNKIRKGKLKKYKFKTNGLKFGTVGLKAAESGIVNFKQAEAARQAITREIKKKGKLWMKIFPHFPVTSKPIGTRMGKGKGQFSYWATKVCSGTILFEICGANFNTVFSALKAGSAKLPVKTKIFN